MAQGYYPPPQYRPPVPMEPRYEYAGIVKRFIALIIDGIIIWIPAFIISLILAATGVVALGMGGATGFALWNFGWIAMCSVMFVVAILYFTLLEGGPRNATIGKRVMHIKVVDDNYQPIDKSKALVRTILRIIPVVIDGIIILVHEKEKRIGDMAAHTLVVKDTPMSAPMQYGAPAPHPQYQQPPPQPQPPQQAPPPQPQYQQPPQQPPQQPQYQRPPQQPQYQAPPPQQPPRQAPPPQMMPCRFCNASIPANSVNCPRCGARLQ